MEMIRKDRIPEVIEKMTIKEKLQVLTGKSGFHSMDMEKYGIPSILYLDGGTGINFMQAVCEAYSCMYQVDRSCLLAESDFFVDLPTILDCLLDEKKEEAVTDERLLDDIHKLREIMPDYIPDWQLPGCFPPGILLGATWDPETVHACASALGKEANYFHVDVLLGTPNVNIHRDPLGGRLFEGYSEDPYLVSKLAPEFVKGIQEEGIIADVKHFAANNQETDRRTVDEHIPERALHEIYLPGFKACVQEGGCKTVMSAYNAINGAFCAENTWLLRDILKKEWGFEGFVVSDWGAAYDQVKAWNAGNDVDMPGSRDVEEAVKAVEEGRLSLEAVDDALYRYLNVLCETPAVKGYQDKELDRKGSTKAAYDSAKEGIVLLKNEGAVLPITKGQSVSFYGEKSKKFLESGGGSANVLTTETTSMYEIVKEKLGAEAVAFGELRDQTDIVVVTVGVIGSEGFDRSEMNVDVADRELLKKIVPEARARGKKVVVVLNVCGPVEVEEYIDQVDAILCVFIPGMEGGRAAADILLGEVNPSGKLPVTFPKYYRDTPTAGNFPGRNNEVWYGEGILVGYRYYDLKDIAPRFPFGYGLSYTTFEILDARVDKPVLKQDNEDSIRLLVVLKNTGNRVGKEVIQVYEGQRNPALLNPPKELVAFQKVELEPGEEKEVVLTIEQKELGMYDEISKSWVVQPDTYILYVGTSSRDITKEVEVQIEGWDPLGFTENIRMDSIAATPGALDKFCEFGPANVNARAAIEMQILFQSRTTLKEFWKQAMEPHLEMSEEEKSHRYQEMLRAMNRYHK